MKARWPWQALKLLLALLALASGAWFIDRLSLGVEGNSYLFSYGFWAEGIPLSLLLAGLVLLSGRVWPSLAIASALVGCLYAVDMQKVRYLAAPLSLFDYYIAKGVDASSAGLFAHYVNWWWVTAVLVVLVGAIGLAWRLEAPVLRGHLVLRACLLTGVACIAYMVTISPLGRGIYDPGRLGIVPQSPFLSQFRAGLLSCLISSDRELDAALQVPIDRNAVRNLRTMLGGAAEAPSADEAAKLPDVVVIQSESFFDPAILKQVPDTQTLLPALHRALQQGVGGSMKVPTFGGGTLRTEFEVLTGIPLAAYPHVGFPYLQISQPVVPGLTRVFDHAGYDTIAVHGNSGEFWNRRYAFRSLGFSRFITSGEFQSSAYKDGLFLSDHSMTDEIIGQLGKATKPTFIFAISIEAHGPYRDIPVDQPSAMPAIPVPDGLSALAREEYAHYAYHIAHADREFGRLWDYLQHRGRPFVLVFYGDHLPGLDHLYQETTFRNGLAADKQRVPWVAVGSGLSDRGKQDIYAWMLAQQVLDLAHVQGTEYLRLTAAAGRRVMAEDKGAGDRALFGRLYSAARLDLVGDSDVTDEATVHAP